MSKQTDPVHGVLQSLAGRSWPGANHNPKLETQLMQAFDHNQQTVPFLLRHRVAASVLGVLLAAGVTFGAVGGMELVRGWLMTMEVNGEVIEVREIVPDEDGAAFVEVPLDLSEFETGDGVTLTFAGETCDKPVDMKIEFADGSGTATIKMGDKKLADIDSLPTDDAMLNVIFSSQPSDERLAELLGDDFDPEDPSGSLAAFLKAASPEGKLRVLTAICGKIAPADCKQPCEAQIFIGSIAPDPPEEDPEREDDEPE